jgi:hypothetical protein
VQPKQERRGPPDSSGTWYLRQAADGAWRLHVRSHNETARLQVLLELTGYPAATTPGGNLFRFRTTLRQLARLKPH